jgi:hypothetical protein
MDWTGCYGVSAVMSDASSPVAVAHCYCWHLWLHPEDQNELPEDWATARTTGRKFVIVLYVQ